MDFATIGKVSSYIRQKNLSFAANYKIRTGQRVTDASGNLSFTQTSMFTQINETSKKTAEELKIARLATLKSKLMAGRKLSNEEMAYLRENDEDLYKKAKHADDAREELKAELKGAKSKQEARQILSRAMVKASAEASAELAACKAGVATGGGAVNGASMTTGISTATSNVTTATENISIGGEISTASTNISSVNENSTSAENISSTNENSTSAENISSTNENSTFAENISSTNENSTSAENISNANENSTSAENISSTNENSTSAENISNVNENSNENQSSAQSILEKFIMTIRALEDEWTKFTKSDEYNELPENSLDDETVYKVVETPDRKFLDAIFTYRQAAFTKNLSKNF